MNEFVVSENETALFHLSAARQAVEKAKTVQDLKGIRDKAEAVRAYAKQAGESLAIQNECAEVKLRAERKAGELLHEMERHRSGRRGKWSHDETVSEPNPPRLNDKYRGLYCPPPTLEELGVDKNESSRWQQEASIPEPAFVKFISEMNAAKEEITQAALLRMAASSKAKKKTRPPADESDEACLSRAKAAFLKLTPTAQKKFTTWLGVVLRDARIKKAVTQHRVEKTSTPAERNEPKDAEWELITESAST
jgi:hypothetical protein